MPRYNRAAHRSRVRGTTDRVKAHTQRLEETDGKKPKNQSSHGARETGGESIKY